MFHRDGIGTAFLLGRKGVRANLRDRRANEHYLEAVAVAAIISIVLAFAAANLSTPIVKTMITEAISMSLAPRVEIREHFAVYGVLPSAQGGLSEDGIRSRYVDRVDWLDDEIVVSMSREFAEEVANLSEYVVAEDSPHQLGFRMARTPDAGRTVFLCGRAAPPPGFVAEAPVHTNIPDEFLPFSCRY